VFRLLSKLSATKAAALAIAKTPGMPQVLAQFCWDQDRMLTDKMASKVIELLGHLVKASRQAASLCKAAGCNWVAEALALRYAILEEPELYEQCGAVIKDMYLSAEKYDKLVASRTKPGKGGRRLLLTVVAEGDEDEEGEGGESDGVNSEDDIVGKAEDADDATREWRTRSVAGLLPLADFPKDTLGALTAGAELDVWFVPYMHPTGKAKMRTMRVKLDGTLSLMQCVYHSTKSHSKLSWSAVLAKVVAIRVGAPTSGIKRKIFGRSPKAHRSLCLDAPISAALVCAGDGSVASGEASSKAKTDPALPVTVLHLELADEIEAKAVRDVLFMVQSFARSQREASIDELTQRVNEVLAAPESEGAAEEAAALEE
jgi:hypothetical protein